MATRSSLTSSVFGECRIAEATSSTLSARSVVTAITFAGSLFAGTVP